MGESASFSFQTGGDLPEPLPGLAVVFGLDRADALFIAPEFFPYIKKAPVAELAGAVRAVHDRVETTRKGKSAIGRAEAPGPEFALVGLLVGDAGMCREPRGVSGLGPALHHHRSVGEGGESGHDERAVGRLEDVGIAVVDGTVVDGSGKGSGRAIVAGLHHLEGAEGLTTSATLLTWRGRGSETRESFVLAEATARRSHDLG